MTLNCPCCGTRDTTETHIGRCRRNTTARTEAEAHGAAQAIPAVTTADLPRATRPVPPPWSPASRR